MIERVSDPAILNRFSAHPDIAPHIGGALDFSSALRETAVFLFGEHGGLCFEWCAPQTYEVHIMLTRAGRGKWGWDATRAALAMLGAERVWARIDPANRPLAMFAWHAGFRDTGAMNLYPAGQPVSYRIFEWRSPCLPQLSAA